MRATQFIIILALLKSACSEHEPKIYEELTEEAPAYQRSVRQLDVSKNLYEPPVFQYRHALQQDRLRARYMRQQQADARNIRRYSVPINPDVVAGLRQYLEKDKQKPISIPFIEENSDWKPFQPTTSPNNEIHNNDLDVASSETNEQKTIIKDRYDQLSQLENLLDKNPSVQLQSLQKVIQPEAKIQHHGSPQNPLPIHVVLPHIRQLQQKLDAVNRVHEQQILADAQRKAEAHVKAQHEAIAIAGQKAQEAALAKISGHNHELSPSEQYNILEDIVPQISYKTVPEHEENFVEDAALHERPPFDLRNIKPRIRPTEIPVSNYEPVIQVAEAPKLHYGSNGTPNLHFRSTEAPNLHYHSSTEFISSTEATKLGFDSSKIQSYSPLLPNNNKVIIHEPIQSTLIEVEPVQKGHQHIQVELVPTKKKSKYLYSEDGQSLYHDVQQYAAKYAFGYKIIDEKHGNNFGHKEERNKELTKGQYFVDLPDGRKQKVEYYADGSGYHAKVSYLNEAKYHYVHNEKSYLKHL